MDEFSLLHLLIIQVFIINMDLWIFICCILIQSTFFAQIVPAVLVGSYIPLTHSHCRSFFFFFFLVFPYFPALQDAPGSSCMFPRVSKC